MPLGYDDRPTASPFPALIFSKLYRRYFPLPMGLAGRIREYNIVSQIANDIHTRFEENPAGHVTENWWQKYPGF